MELTVKIGLTPKPNNLGEYEFLDVVSAGGSSYISLVDNNTYAIEEGLYWQKATLGAYDVAVAAGYNGTENEFALALTELDNKIDKTSITNELGDSEELVVSQKGIKNEVQKLQLADTQQSHSIKQIEDTLNSININQEAKITSEGYGTVSLPKNAANGGMDVKLEGLTEEVEGESLNFLPTGRVRSDIGGRNLLTRSDILSWGNYPYVNMTEGEDEFGHYYRYRFGNLTNFNLSENIVFKENTQYVLMAEGILESGANPRFVFRYTDGTLSSNLPYGGTSSLIVRSIISDKNKTIDYITHNHSLTGFVKLYNIQLLEGNKPMKNWTPAPEDVLAGTVKGTGTSLYLTAPELRSNGAVKDEIRKGANGYELVKRINEVDGTVLATPEIIPISYGGILNSAESGTVYHEPIIADAGVYDTKIDVLLTDYPISVIEEVIKYENGINTYLDVSKAVIAGDKLSFTHPDLVGGDLVMFTYAYDLESTIGKMTLTHYDSRYVIADTANGKFYKQKIVSTNGVASIVLEEV